MMTPWDAGHAPADPLRVRILDLRERIAGDCRDCGENLCPEHAEAADLADGFENAYMQVANGSTAWCDLAVKLKSEMN
jgi:hypothetical protein